MLTKEETVFAHSFQKMTLEDAELFNHYLQKLDGSVSSCMNFSSIIGWSDSAVPYFRVVNNALCLIFLDYTYKSWMSFPPLCCYREGFPTEAVDELDSLFCDMGMPLKMYHVKEWMLPYFENLCNYNIAKHFDAAYSDYIYSAEAFSEYLQKPDIKYNLRYIRRRFDPQLEPLNDENVDDFLSFFKKVWCPYHSCADCIYGCMFETLKNMLMQSKDTGLRCFLVRIGGECVAYTGYTFCKDQLAVLIKKVDKSKKGLTDFVHEAILSDATEHYSAVNYTEDMGNEGMRKYKQKLAQYTLSHNYELIFRRYNSEKQKA